ncbi:hypothetical protein HanXRQr2_Chr09g0378991 [Helianthus annuus]|uniref:Uncharacterized protein n=1 Tax=Helianthus annuus TaxID=4232 RepID=A0A9K3I569_HELAN|nr:hypothetical protein HanXRQr2_Chr09g0378991 [Helianthus annuus]
MSWKNHFEKPISCFKKLSRTPPKISHFKNYKPRNIKHPKSEGNIHAKLHLK